MASLSSCYNESIDVSRYDYERRNLLGDVSACFQGAFLNRSAVPALVKVPRLIFFLDLRTGEVEAQKRLGEQALIEENDPRDIIIAIIMFTMF